MACKLVLIPLIIPLIRILFSVLHLVNSLIFQNKDGYGGASS